MTVNLRALVAKLNSTTRGAVEAAAGLCLSRTHYDVEVEHFLVKLLDATDSDIAFIMRHYGVDRSRLAADLARSLDKLKTGNARTPALSPSLVNLLTEAWTLGSVDYGGAQVRSGYVLLALVATDELLRLANGDVPPPLRNVSVRTLDLALLQAGAGVKGEFENRLKGLIEEVKNSPTPIILFIDEAHTMIGAGGQAGQNDAANLLKPALARGEMSTLAATTWSEYKKFFEKDPALTRRFQVVKVEEPGEDQCIVMLRGTVPALEKHHGVRILDQGLESAVRLSHRYLPDRQLPDKALSVLDTACARLALGQQATPAPVEDTRRQLDDLAVQTRVLEREAALGVDHRERLAAIAAERAELGAPPAAPAARGEGGGG